MFLTTVTNVLITLAFILPGFLLCKCKAASPEHLSTLSAVLIYVCSPAMIVSALVQVPFSWDVLGQMGLFFAVTLVLQVLFMALLYAFLHRRFDDARFRVLTIGAVMGNTGFFGMPVIRLLFPTEPIMALYSAMFCVSMNILVFTVGVFCLTGERKYMSLRAALVNPSVISVAVGLCLFGADVVSVLPAGLYDTLFGAVDLLGKMTAPLCMIILGVRLGTVRLTRLFARPFVYLTALCKLVLFPLFCFGLCSLLPGLSPQFLAAVLILSAVPCGSIILNLAEMHHSQEELAANSVLLTTLLCFLTIPVLVLLL